ncbi:MAG: hypothetical protein WC412_00415 [Candidatus Omnitrophota bacterium]|jgi:hypothetical protein
MGKVMSHEEIVVEDVAKALSQAVYNPAGGQSASFAMVCSEGGAMRYFVNGQNPSASSGVLLEEGDIIELPSIYHIKDFRVIKAGDDAGKLVVTYES